jgi:hypothetical protein
MTGTAGTAPSPAPRINFGVAVVEDFLLIFGGASAKAIAQSEQGW